MNKFPMRLKHRQLYVIGATLLTGFLFNSDIVLAQTESSSIEPEQAQTVVIEEAIPTPESVVLAEEVNVAEDISVTEAVVEEESHIAEVDYSTEVDTPVEANDNLVDLGQEEVVSEIDENVEVVDSKMSTLTVEDETPVISENEMSLTIPELNTFSEKASVQLKNQWQYSDADKSWTYYNDLGEVSKLVSDQGYFIDGKKQTDSHISINGNAYYFDKNGQLAKSNDWVYSDGLTAWFKSDENGLLVNEVTPWGHYVNGRQVFDKLVTVLDQSYYFEPLEWGGTMAFNKWSYSPIQTSWFFSEYNGAISKFVTPEKYTINDEEQKDTHVSILGTSYYYDNTGKRLTNDQAYSQSMNAHFRAGTDGTLNYEVTPWGHYVNGQQQFDTTVNVSGKEYYFEPLNWGGTMAFNKWSYSPIENSWYFSNPNGVIGTFVTPDVYKVNGVLQKDAHVSIHGTSFYYLPTGKRHVGGNVHSKQLNAWFATDNKGVLISEITPWGYYKNGAQQFDVLASAGGKKYYFEPQGWNGTMAFNKWSYSPNNKYWYISDANGVVTQRDKVGPVLPSYVSLDRGQWTMYSLYQDGWESGCWLSTAASGINSAGGSASPWSLISEITRTEDPRTGMLSHPRIVNNWDLGGAYSAMWPEALVPVIQKHVPNAADLTGASFQDIKRELANGNTVQVYFAWAQPNIRLNTGNGPFYASRNYHSYLLTGYNSTGFYHQEHWGNPRNNHISFSSLQWQYNNYGKKAISYRKASILP